MSADPHSDHLPPLHRDLSLLTQWCGPRTLVVSSPSAQRVARAAGLDFAGCRHVDTVQLTRSQLTAVDRLVAVGSGATIDTAALAAHQAQLPILIIPTVLSTDAPFSTVTAARDHGTVVYHETGAADAVLLDNATLLASDWHLHHNGLGDLLAIESASHDWQQRNPGRQTGIAAAARALVDTATNEPEAWLCPSVSQLELLVDLLTTKVHLGLLAGHPSFEEGTEHYLAYFLEPHLNGHAWHGELLFACLLVSAYLQEWPTERYDRIRALATHLPHLRSPHSLMAPETLRELLPRFSDYCQQHSLSNSIITTQPPTQDQVETAVAAWERGW